MRYARRFDNPRYLMQKELAGDYGILRYLKRLTTQPHKQKYICIILMISIGRISDRLGILLLDINRYKFLMCQTIELKTNSVDTLSLEGRITNDELSRAFSNVYRASICFKCAVNHGFMRIA